MFTRIVTLIAVALLFAASEAVAAFPGQNGRIAYTSGGRIATVQPNGTGRVYLTSTGTRAANPNWSADGTRIVYQANAGKWTQIWRMLANGSAKVNLSNSKTNDTQPAFFPDGKIAFVRSSQIWRMNADGTGKTRLTAPPAGYSDDRPSVSPDGTKIAFQRLGYPFSGAPPEGSGQILVVNADGSGLANLSGSVGKTSDYAPDWAPNGQRIVFTRYVDGVCDRIFAMDATGANQTRLADLNAAPGAAYSPDGTRVVFEGFATGGNTIETVATTGGSPTVVVPGMTPSWQPLR